MQFKMATGKQQQSSSSSSMAITKLTTILTIYSFFVLTLPLSTLSQGKEQKHFVLVHGAGHGAWCWYKVKPRLESAGHRVTALDLEASGINLKFIGDVHTMADYSQPLLEFIALLSPSEKVILVGHSLGGLNLALAMEKFPEKISVAVFLTALMPDTVHQPSYVIEQDQERYPDIWVDNVIATYGNTETQLFGPKSLALKLYQLSPVEDLELAKSLIRPASSFVNDLSKAKKFTNKAYGSVARVFVVCDQDKAIPVEFQRWMIENVELKNVMEIRGADHMAMISKPQEVFDSLLDIAHRHASTF